GLIGGSLALKLHEKKLSARLMGVEASTAHAALAMERELVDEILPLHEAIAQADIVALCVPADVLLTLLPEVLNRVTRQIVFDMGSTKELLLRTVEQHPKRGRYVATHPMWGTEYSGPAAAQKDAFEQRAVVLCNGEQSDTDAREWVKSMYEKIGMRIVEMEASAHDLHAAYISHISHVLSFSLANTVLEKEKEEAAIFELASAGFESTVRLAKSNPAMWVPIFKQNKKNLLDVLDEHIAGLQQFRHHLEEENEEAFRQFIERANTIRKIIK
ncbi:MAG: prephenate dehydrogenase, partial [Dinghuibacter sp.]|nr:prephenate dehydrogenase [Dinghuibacter sp.]